MNKPIQMIYDEFQKDMAQTINKYSNHIPAVFMQQFFHNLEDQFKDVAQLQLTQATEVYNEKLKEEATAKEKPNKSSVKKS